MTMYATLGFLEILLYVLGMALFSAILFRAIYVWLHSSSTISPDGCAIWIIPVLGLVWLLLAGMGVAYLAMALPIIGMPLVWVIVLAAITYFIGLRGKQFVIGFGVLLLLSIVIPLVLGIIESLTR